MKLEASTRLKAVMKNQPCKTVEQAAKIAMQWHMANRGKASKS